MITYCRLLEHPPFVIHILSGSLATPLQNLFSLIVISPDYLRLMFLLRCLLVDFSKAFHTIYHMKLDETLKRLDIPLSIINRMIYFLTDKTKLVVINGKQSLKLLIIRSIVHVSVISLFLFLIYIADLRLLSPGTNFWLEGTFGVRGRVLAWFKSYLTGRTYCVIYAELRLPSSRWHAPFHREQS